MGLLRFKEIFSDSWRSKHCIPLLLTCIKTKMNNKGKEEKKRMEHEKIKKNWRWRRRRRRGKISLAVLFLLFCRSMHCAVDLLLMYVLFKTFQESRCVSILFCPEYHQVIEILANNEQRLDFKARFHKVMKDCQSGLLTTVDQGQ